MCMKNLPRTETQRNATATPVKTALYAAALLLMLSTTACSTLSSKKIPRVTNWEGVLLSQPSLSTTLVVAAHSVAMKVINLEPDIVTRNPQPPFRFKEEE